MKFRMGVIGYGKRGSSVTREILLRMKDVQVIAICDSYEDRVREGQADVEKKEGKPANGYVDYREMLEKEPLDGVYIAAAWEYHAEIALEAMRRGVPVALEVGGAYSIESLWRMVRTQEETGTPLWFAAESSERSSIATALMHISSATKSSWAGRNATTACGTI